MGTGRTRDSFGPIHSGSKKGSLSGGSLFCHSVFMATVRKEGRQHVGERSRGRSPLPGRTPGGFHNAPDIVLQLSHEQPGCLTHEPVGPVEDADILARRRIQQRDDG